MTHASASPDSPPDLIDLSVPTTDGGPQRLSVHLGRLLARLRPTQDAGDDWTARVRQEMARTAPAFDAHVADCSDTDDIMRREEALAIARRSLQRRPPRPDA
ncbi:hypothetical protein [Mesobacterium pallidum]|uniref:hypothetical protein n=1 Tax=Mesobacterium pallidum TaxID=2872037 RepID=UPI001EE1E4A8|nr:hypothetical protein [Mesobacterium pallidum]